MTDFGPAALNPDEPLMKVYVRNPGRDQLTYSVARGRRERGGPVCLYLHNREQGTRSYTLVY